MANVMFKKGLLANLPATHAEGTFYVTTDERAIYLDVDSSTRIRLGDFQEFASLTALQANTNPSTSALYYISDVNCLAKWNGEEYVHINPDTGATSVEVVGSGNAVTAASYDAATRKLTLTMGETFATKAFVGSIPEGYSETNIVAYVNKKAEETLNAASGGSSESAASVLAALNTYKGQTDPRLEALEAIDHDHTNKAVLDGITAEKVTAWDGAQAAAEATAADALSAAKTELEGKISAAQTAAEKVANDNNAAMNTRVEALEAIDHDHANKAELDLISSGDKAKWDKAVEDLAGEISRAKGEEAKNAQAAADALAEAQKKVASVGAGDASVTVGGTATAPTVAVKLDPAANNAIKLGADGLKVEIGAAPEYSVVKDENSGDYAAVYHLTKDGVNVGAAINIPKDLVVKSGSVAGDEIVLVLNDEAATEIKIPVGSLIEYVTSGSAAGDMVVVTVSDDHKVTASITDGAITLAKLSTEVQTAIGKAHSHENADVLAGISADDVAAWDAAEENAKDYADGLNTAMNSRVEALEAIDHDHSNKTVLDGITAEKVAAWDGAQAGAEATAAAALAAAKGELEGEIADVDAKFAGYSTTEQMNAAIKVVDDKFAGYSTTEQMNAAIKVEADRADAAEKLLAGRLDVLEAIDHDAYIGYADQAEAEAKAYADSLVMVWGSF